MSRLLATIKQYCADNPGGECRPLDDLPTFPLILVGYVDGGRLYRVSSEDLDGRLFLQFIGESKECFVVNSQALLQQLVRSAKGTRNKTVTNTFSRSQFIADYAKPWLEENASDGSLDIMLDAESFGDCIPSFAIVPFNPLTGSVMPREGCILARLDINWQQKQGLLCDADTLMWWLTKTSDAARKALYDLPGSIYCKDAAQLDQLFMDMLLAWDIDQDEQHHRIWCKPGSYDWPKLEALCKAGDMKVPFHFRTSRCLRTLADLGHQSSKQERDQWKIDNNITTHDPYDDCRLQAWECTQALQGTPSKIEWQFEDNPPKAGHYWVYVDSIFLFWYDPNSDHGWYRSDNTDDIGNPYPSWATLAQQKERIDAFGPVRAWAPASIPAAPAVLK